MAVQTGLASTLMQHGYNPADPKVEMILDRLNKNPNLLSQSGMTWQQLIALNNEVKRLKQQQQPAQPQQGTSVAQEKLQEVAMHSPDMGAEGMAGGGLAHLPVHQFNPEHYASGGIVAFSGGDVVHGAESLFVGPDGQAYTREQLEAARRANYYVDPQGEARSYAQQQEAKARYNPPAVRQSTAVGQPLEYAASQRSGLPSTMRYEASRAPLANTYGLSSSGMQRSGQVLDMLTKGARAVGSNAGLGAAAMLHSPEAGANSDYGFSRTDFMTPSVVAERTANLAGSVDEVGAQLDAAKEARRKAEADLGGLKERAKDPEGYQARYKAFQDAKRNEATLRQNYEAMVGIRSEAGKAAYGRPKPTGEFASGTKDAYNRDAVNAAIKNAEDTTGLDQSGTAAPAGEAPARNIVTNRQRQRPDAGLGSTPEAAAAAASATPQGTRPAAGQGQASF